MSLELAARGKSASGSGLFFQNARGENGTMELFLHNASDRAMPTPSDTIILSKALFIALLRMAEQHVEDIDSGVEDGTYDAEDNRDLPAKQASIMEANELAQAMAGEALPAASSLPI